MTRSSSSRKNGVSMSESFHQSGDGMILDTLPMEQEYWINQLLVPRAVFVAQRLIDVLLVHSVNPTESSLHSSSSSVATTNSSIQLIVQAMLSMVYFFQCTSFVTNSDVDNDENVVLTTPALKLMGWNLASARNQIFGGSETGGKTRNIFSNKRTKKEMHDLLLSSWYSYVAFRFIVPSLWKMAIRDLSGRIDRQYLELNFNRQQLRLHQRSGGRENRNNTTTSSHRDSKDNSNNSKSSNNKSQQFYDRYGFNINPSHPSRQLQFRRRFNSALNLSKYQKMKTKLERYKWLLYLLRNQIQGMFIPTIQLLTLFRFWNSNTSTPDPLMILFGLKYQRQKHPAYLNTPAIASARNNSNTHTSAQSHESNAQPNNRHSLSVSDISWSSTFLTNSSNPADDTREGQSIVAASSSTDTPELPRQSRKSEGVLPGALHSVSSPSLLSSPSYSLNVDTAYRRWQYQQIMEFFFSKSSALSPASILLELYQNFPSLIFKPYIYDPFVKPIRVILKRMLYHYYHHVTTHTNTTIAIPTITTTSWNVENNSKHNNSITANISGTNDKKQSLTTTCPLCLCVPVVPCRAYPCNHIFCYTCLYNDAAASFSPPNSWFGSTYFSWYCKYYCEVCGQSIQSATVLPSLK